VFTSVTGVSGSGKSSLVGQVLVELVAEGLGHGLTPDEEGDDRLERTPVETLGGRIAAGMEAIGRLVRVDQKPIGRTPRSNLATYTGLFDPVRKLFAATKAARARRYDAGRFSFNVADGRCETCQGEGSVMVELLFLPSVYAPCPACHGARYDAKTLEIQYREKSIADVLALTVDAAREFFADEPPVLRPLDVLSEVGLGYLRLGQPATELFGGEAQRIKLATELQRTRRGDTLYVLDEPTTGLHPADRRAGRIGQHRHRRGARDARGGGERLGHRHRPRRGGRGQPGRRVRASRRGGQGVRQPHRALPGPIRRSRPGEGPVILPPSSRRRSRPLRAGRADLEVGSNASRCGTCRRRRRLSVKRRPGRRIDRIPSSDARRVHGANRPRSRVSCVRREGSRPLLEEDRSPIEGL